MSTRLARAWRALRLGLCAALVSASQTPAHAAPVDVTTATVADLGDALARGSLTSEQLVRAYLARISAYEDRGPSINALITLNPGALATAGALDRERRRGRVRGPLHGIPVILKDNFDTADLPTTAGSQLLAGWRPSRDAAVVRRLREAGAIVLAKANLGEFAGGGSALFGLPEATMKATFVPSGFGTAGGQTLNPHDPAYSPSGSSGGTAAALAAVYAPLGLGTDTGSSVRAPAAYTGTVALKTTRGLVSRAGVVPLALSLDVVGPMARHVADVALLLGVLTGVDPDDPDTRASEGRVETDYLRHLRPGALRGARIGVARDFAGHDAESDRVLEAAADTLRRLGAEIVDPVRVPRYVLESRRGIFTELVSTEFRAQITDYLRAAPPGMPRSFDELVARANDPATGYRSPGKALGLLHTQTLARELDDPVYLAIRDHALAATRAGLEAMFARDRLDAILSLPSPKPPMRIDDTAAPVPGFMNLANQAGLPELVVPAGMTQSGLPITIALLGPAFAEGRLLAYGHEFEQATRALRLPKYTPPLPTDRVGR